MISAIYKCLRFEIGNGKRQQNVIEMVNFQLIVIKYMIGLDRFMTFHSSNAKQMLKIVNTINYLRVYVCVCVFDFGITFSIIHL